MSLHHRAGHDVPHSRRRTVEPSGARLMSWRQAHELLHMGPAGLGAPGPSIGATGTALYIPSRTLASQMCFRYEAPAWHWLTFLFSVCGGLGGDPRRACWRHASNARASNGGGSSPATGGVHAFATRPHQQHLPATGLMETTLSTLPLTAAYVRAGNDDVEGVVMVARSHDDNMVCMCRWRFIGEHNGGHPPN